jgi:CheY-like chemotaxis protein
MSHPSRILVVDDEPLNLQVFEYNFGDEFDLLYASSAEEALATLQTNPVAVIIADHRMPGMFGLDLLALVARQFPTVVRVLLTAHTDVPLLLEAVNRGVLFRYVAKPWDADGMRQDMQMALSRHREEIQRQRLLDFAVSHMHTTAALAAALAPPINAVAELLDDALGRLGPGDEAKAVSPITQAALKVQALREGVTRVARRHENVVRPLRLGELAKEALDGAVLRQSPSDIRVGIVDESQDACVLSGGAPLVEGITALVRNGLESAARGPEPRSVEVRVHAPSSNQVRVSVSDSGGGFSAEGHPSLFRSGRGEPGLGLAIAASVAREHGGDLDLTGAQHGRVALSLPVVTAGA